MSLTRRVFGATGLITVANGLVRVLAVLAAPLLTRVLGPSPYAISTLVATMTSLLVTLSLLGIDMSYARFYFGGTRGGAEEVERLCWRFMLASATVMALLGGFAWGGGVAAGLGLDPSFAIILALGIFLTPVTTMAQTRARLQGRYGRLAMSILAMGAATTFSSIALAFAWRSDAWALLVGGVIGLLVGAGVAGMPAPGALLRRTRLGRGEALAVIRLGIPGVATAAMFWVLSSADRWIIALYHDQETLGVYSFAAAFGLLGMMLNSSIVTVWFPEAAKSHEEDPVAAATDLGRLWARLVTLLGVVWLVVASAGGEMLRIFADPRFHGGAVYIPWIALFVFFYGVGSLANTGLMLSNDLRPAAWWWLAGAAVCVLVHFLVIPRWGALGAAVTVGLTAGCIAAGVIWSSERRLPLRVPWGSLTVALLVLAAAGVGMAPRWSESPLLSLMLKFPAGVLAAAAALRVVAPDWLGRALAWRPRRPRATEEEVAEAPPEASTTGSGSPAGRGRG